MKLLFCGLGSIGERHLQNILNLGYTDVIAYRTRNAPLRTVKATIPTFTSLSDALKEKPDVAIISNPSSMHVDTAQTLANAGIHLFIEKPLSTSQKGLLTLKKTVKKNNLVVGIGFMLRFHPAILQIKEWIRNDTYGFPINIHTFWGEYLPDWHPWEAYETSYAAQTSLGGGPVHTLCHDLDALTDIFGLPSTVYANATRPSSLRLTTDHSVDILCEWERGHTGVVHLDFICRPPKRAWTIIHDKGRIEFDYYTNTLKSYHAFPTPTNTSKTFQTFDRNMLFIEEIKDFLQAVNTDTIPRTSLEDGIDNVRLLVAIDKSLVSHKRVVV